MDHEPRRASLRGASWLRKPRLSLGDVLVPDRRAPLYSAAVNLPRRRFLGLAGGLALGAWAGRARAIGASNHFRWAQVQYEGRWNPRESGPMRLMWEVTKRTSIECEPKPLAVRLSDVRALGELPFLCLAGVDALPKFSATEVRNLRSWLARGGFLYVECSEPREGSPFDASVRALLAEVLPGEPLRLAPADHVLYRSFYLLTQPVGRVIHKPYFEAIDRDDRSVIVYSQNDACGAWCRDGGGNWEMDVVPGGARQREMAFRYGVNIVMYALCGNYKRDQVHVQYLLRRRRQ